MSGLNVRIALPDLWQQDALRALQAGKDVVVDAPTGSGKTYIFELFVEGGSLEGQAVYTVPTRALANDKLRDWRKRRWNVGIATGDIAENLEAPVIVATLETQKGRLLHGQGPKLLVIDEYQMIGDQQRGVNYELAVALAPEHTQLLLMSGSVGNPQSIVKWLKRLGRDAVLIQTRTRPVPLEEIDAEALPGRLPNSVQGFWPRIIAKALKFELAPLLAFAPRRRAAEKLALQLARMLPEEEPLELTSEQKQLAGDTLARLLRLRIAFHHSGLDYAQRAALIEPLAKAGQLRVVVATMGLSAGINFSMRSVLVTDREYRTSERFHNVRPDELLQMFGRAGRRGLDKKGYIIVASGKPRFSEARPLDLKRSNQIDWPSLLALMDAAKDAGQNPMDSARAVAASLFSTQRIALGLKNFHPPAEPAAATQADTQVQTVHEFQTPDEVWERRRPPQRRPLAEAYIYERDEWRPALKVARSLSGLAFGTLCRLGSGEQFRFGREVPVARFGRHESEGELVLTRWASKSLQSLNEHTKSKISIRKSGWSLEAVEQILLPRLPELTQGGRFLEWRARDEILYARLDFSQAETFAFIDSTGRALLEPPERVVDHIVELSYRTARSRVLNVASSPAQIWYQLGLIDGAAHPTRRGKIFSFFNHGEGLAIASALEEPSYRISELVVDLANLRAGYRFEEMEEYSGRFGNICRQTYGEVNYPGYLRKGVPENYGDGASEVLSKRMTAQRHDHGAELLPGDIERARVEWRSLLNHIVNAPDLEWDRWHKLKAACRAQLKKLPKPIIFDDFPPLTQLQNQRHKSFLRFD